MHGVDLEEHKEVQSQPRQFKRLLFEYDSGTLYWWTLIAIPNGLPQSTLKLIKMLHSAAWTP